MPVLVNYSKCNCAPNCFAAMACPNDALHVDKPALKVWVEPEKCGDCPGKCLNFCDAVALKYAPTLEELDIIRKELSGEFTLEQVAQARAELAEQQKAKAEAEAEEEAQPVVVTKPVKLTASNFMDEVGQTEVPILIDFWAVWCGPCKQTDPIIEELATEFSGKMKFGKVNVDEEQEIAGQFGIQSIPTMMILFQGQLVDRIVGAVDKAQLRARVQRVVEAVAQLQAQQGGGQPDIAAPEPKAAPGVARATIKPRMMPKR